MTVSNDILEIGLFASLQFADCTDNGKGRQAALATLCRFLLATSLVQCSTVQLTRAAIEAFCSQLKCCTLKCVLLRTKLKKCSFFTT